MNIITSFDQLPKIPFAFTIGMFDGVHLGHQYLLHALNSFGLPSVVLTFPEHPLRVLKSAAPRLITQLPVKLALLEAVGVHTTLVLPFTQEFASTPFDEVLKAVSAKQLLFGKGAAFGQRRLGDETAVRNWSVKHATEVEYLEKKEFHGQQVSSSRIREAIEKGDLTLAEQFLGHPHLLFVPQDILRWDVSHLALPPNGTYRLLPDLTAHLSDRRWIELSRPLSTPTILHFSRNTP
jgi:riboflavin kinase/FMN adenylyltransferase